MMRCYITSVDHRIPHRFVRVVDAHLGSNAPSETLCSSGLHLVEAFQIFLNRVVPMLRCNPIHAFLAHLELLGVFGVGFSSFDELYGQIIEMFKVVRGVGHLVTVYTKKSEIF